MGHIVTGKETTRLRHITKNTYLDKIFNLYINNYKWKELNYQQNDFFFRQMWDSGKIAVFKEKNTDKLKGINNFNEYDGLIFTPFAPITYNIYNYPINVNLINTRGVKFIPTKSMEVDEENGVVITWGQRNKKPIKSIVNYYVDKIVDLEMLLNIQTIVHKMPFLISVTEENKERINQFMENLLEDNPVIFCNMDEAQLFKALVSGAPYIMDKLYVMKQNYENELLTYLGIDNLGGSEKKEHLITSEVESNDMLIKDNCDTFVDILNEFAERVEKFLGMKLTLECKSETYLMTKEQNSDNIENENKEEEL